MEKEINIISNAKIEIWKDIKGFEGIYQVSSLGRVKSLDRTFWNSSKGGYMCHWKERILNGGLVGTFVKYRYVILCDDNYRRKYLVHKLVFENFIQEVPERMTIDHIDSDPLNNELSNLQLATYSENINKSNKAKHHTQNSYIVTDTETNKSKIYKTTKEVAEEFDIDIVHVRTTALNKGTTKLLKGRYSIKPIDLIT